MRVGKEKQGSSQIEGVIAAAATSAEAFNDGGRHAALRAERSRNGLQFRPAVRAGRRPLAFKDSGIAKDTRLRKKQIQDRVDHGNLSSTQRAKSIYSGWGKKSIVGEGGILKIGRRKS